MSLRDWDRPRLVALSVAVLCVVALVGMVVWNSTGCRSARDDLVEAKRSGTGVAEAARDARRQGCDVGDLIDPSVG